MHTAPLLILPLLAACSDPGPDLVLTDTHNYSFSGELVAEEHALLEGHDSTVDWSAFTEDIRGRPVVPEEIDQVSLVAFNLSQEEVLEAVSHNDLKQSAVRDFRLFDNDEGRTSMLLSELSILGNDFVPESDFVVHDDTWTWMVSLWDLDRDGRDDILSSVFLVPDPGSDITEAAIDSDSARFDFQADLHSAEPLVTAEGYDTYTLDWSQVTADASGHAYDPLEGDRLLVGHLATDDLSEVESVFVQLPEQVDALYRMDVRNEVFADLSQATTDDGEPFGGFSAGGTWLVGIECTTCTSPAPLVLAVVEVR